MVNQSITEIKYESYKNRIINFVVLPFIKCKCSKPQQFAEKDPSYEQGETAREEYQFHGAHN